LNGTFNCDCLPGGHYWGFRFFFFFFEYFFKKIYITSLAVYCPSISNEENTRWNQTFANGSTIYGECLNGFQSYSGPISRACIQSGSNGNWSSITGSCDGIFFYIIIYNLKFKIQINRY